MKLKQNSLFKGTQEFQLEDDHVDVRIKLPFKDEEILKVMLTVLDPEPVIDDSYLHFNSRVNGEPLLSLFLGKPNAREFNAFVKQLKQKAAEEFNAFAGLRPAVASPALNGNVFEDPPEFEDSGQDHENRIRQELDPVRIEEALQMLRQNMEEDDIQPLISAMEALRHAPENQALMAQAVEAFNGLGSNQGAVLTYAPYVSIILSDDPYGW